MKKSVRYTDEPMGNVQVVPDFLPSPDQLVLKEDNVKVTIALSKTSISFFKKIAREHRTPYQTMIRQVLNVYADRFSEKPPTLIRPPHVKSRKVR